MTGRFAAESVVKFKSTREDARATSETAAKSHSVNRENVSDLLI